MTSRLPGDTARTFHVGWAAGPSSGSEAGWDLFVRTYREKLYRAARAVAPVESAARELAESVYADLFGTRVDNDGRRISKLESYVGRGSLEGWLRMVLAQEYVNRF